MALARATADPVEAEPVGITLRPYQLEATEAVRRTWIDAMRAGTQPAVIVQLPTGCGKTVTGLHILAQVVRHGLGAGRPRPRTLWLGHRRELVHPPAATFRERWPSHAEHVGIVMAERDDWDAAHVFASVPTLSRERRLERLLSAGAFAAVVVDECHHSAAPSWARLIQRIDAHAEEAGGRCYRLGLSATPWREGGV